MSKYVDFDFPYEDPDISYDEKPYDWNGEQEYKLRYSKKDFETVNTFRKYVDSMIDNTSTIDMLNSLIELAKIGSKTRIVGDGNVVISPIMVDAVIDHYGDILKKELERYQKIVEVMKEEPEIEVNEKLKSRDASKK